MCCQSRRGSSGVELNPKSPWIPNSAPREAVPCTGRAGEEVTHTYSRENERNDYSLVNYFFTQVSPCTGRCSLHTEFLAAMSQHQACSACACQAVHSSAHAFLIGKKGCCPVNSVCYVCLMSLKLHVLTGSVN